MFAGKKTTAWQWKIDGVYLILAVVYVLLLTAQINLPPLERYPGWDYFWGDTLQAGKLHALKHALRSFELPAINPYIGFGWNAAGDTTSVQHFVCPFNLLILFLNPGMVLAVRTATILVIGAAGAYLYLSRITGNRLISLLGGASYVSLPLCTGMVYHATVGNNYYFVPGLLFLIHKILEHGSIRRIFLFVAFSVLTFSSGDIHGLVLFPSVVGGYCFAVAWGYYRLGFLNAFKWASLLVFLNILAGSFYILPLYDNLRFISSAMGEFGFRAAPLTSFVSLQGIQGFLGFFHRYCLPTLAKPMEGSGLLLYVSVFFYSAIFLSFVFWRLVFRKNPRQAAIPLSLVGLGLLMFMISVVFYAFPAISSAGHGTLRYHINLLPFVVLLAGLICFSAINRMAEFRNQFYILIGISALILDLMIFSIPRSEPPQADPIARWFYLQRFAHVGANCSNRAGVRCLADMWQLLPWLNLSFVILLFIFGVAPYIKRSLVRNACNVILVACAMLLPLWSISVHNELRASQQSGWQVLGRNSYHWNSYLKRKACIDGLIDRYNPNYRTLPASADVFKMGGRGRNWKLLAETELNIQDCEKVLFSYRETMHPFEGLLYSTFRPEGGFVPSNWFPPLAEQMVGNLDIIRFMGVRWILSADATISHPDLIYRGECVAEKCPFYETAADGTVYIYEVRNPLGIAFLADDYGVVDLLQSKQRIFSNKESPWNKRCVFLEQQPALGAEGARRNLVAAEVLAELKSGAKIVKETFNSIEVQVEAPAPKYLVLSYIFRPRWKAFLGSEELTIYRAYGGFMSVQVPAGRHTIKFRYTPTDVYWGLMLTALAFVIPSMLGCRMRQGRIPGENQGKGLEG